MKSLRLFASSFAGLAILITITACSGYHYVATPVSSASAYPTTLQQAQQDKSQGVLHSGLNLYTITSLQVDQAKPEFTVQLNRVDSSNIPYLNNPTIASKPKNGLKATKSQYHIYMKDSTSYTLDEPHTIPLDYIGKMELWNKD